MVGAVGGIGGKFSTMHYHWPAVGGDIVMEVIPIYLSRKVIISPARIYLSGGHPGRIPEKTK